VHISFLLSQLFVNKPEHKDISGIKPDIHKNFKPEEIIPKDVLIRSDSVAEKRAEQKDTKANMQYINNEMPPICDTVEFSDNAIDYANKTGLGGVNLSGENVTGGGMAGSGTESGEGADYLKTVILSVGVLMIVFSLFFMPKGLVLTLAGVIITIYGVLKR